MRISKKTAVALGTFDGLHLGHQALIRTCQREAAKSGLKTLVYTFSGVPAELFFPQKRMRLFTTEEKIAAFKTMGVDAVKLNDFTAEYAKISPHAFLQQLTANVAVKLIVAGNNFTFGEGGKGDIRLLQTFGEQNGIRVLEQQSILQDGLLVSSTRIRRLIEAGKMEEAAALLNKAYTISGIAVNGLGLASKLGFATANILPPEKKVLPAFGVYLTESEMDGKKYPSITNVGVKPTVTNEKKVLVETHLIGIQCPLYGKHIKVSFRKMMRPELRFENIEKLKEQVLSDLNDAKRYFGIL